ncbi:MAG: FixH family protein [Bacteroidales bacterium]|jgi:nitrogen fixation protein FixH|nr:FixH family protein [Bacteroidales bacterium]
MKWNWGTKLALAMAAFMIMIIIFAVLMMRENIQLVEKDYYPKGQAFQELIQKKTNTVPFEEEIKYTIGQGQLQIMFPVFFEPEQIKGTVHFYNRMEEFGDKTFELKPDANGFFKFPLPELHGRYIVKIDWTFNNQGYYTEKTIVIE